MDEILKQIIEKRKINIKKKGYSLGINIPEKRKFPVVTPTFKKGVLICEIKRGSPSEGIIDKIPDPVEWAKIYLNAKADVISVLTEEDYFYGSLIDLMKIKNTFPKASLLRKDFIIYEDEIEVSYNAGADLVLLIASVLLHIDKRKSIELLRKFKEKVESFGMLPLIEVHNEEELDKVLELNPKLIGVNSRDLNTFKISRGYPIALKNKIPENINVVYESGIRNGIDAFFCGSTGFKSILVGSSIIKSMNTKNKISEIKKGFFNGIKNKNNFYNIIFNKIFFDKKTVYSSSRTSCALQHTQHPVVSHSRTSCAPQHTQRPVVKICGITNLEDAEAAVKYGADAIGFVFAESPRKISIYKAKEISRALGNKVLKVGVVVDKDIKKVVRGVKQGWLDAIQFHGEINDEKISGYNVPWYKAVRVKTYEDFQKEYSCPIILYDAFSEDLYGGTGKRIDSSLLDYAKGNGIRLFLAGGLNPDNIRKIIKVYSPLMIDASSGIESLPGKKDIEKMKKFFDEIKKAQS